MQFARLLATLALAAGLARALPVAWPYNVDISKLDPMERRDAEARVWLDYFQQQQQEQ